MDPLAILAAFNAIVDGAERLGPVIARMRQDGLITKEQQQQTVQRIDNLRAETFTGPEWQTD